ncbi:conserved hypothetical protein [Talaromyces stipitatus ATCC 10500]|uniref:Uncharacterized protein n=1 Tax=Talaromyces stipitatus (strain ATCC 10500 / CBS 375.48 / QM 6759 / NRRL 1006) TaxID=441959 RepID=B8MDJ8_TALSN|nr:uncharacterized protein TSTA_117430 [Talaromyces stipitatus ATCC 10500]EED17961.1 conserved hypothetical protein [Talaromyces stipitatus ATCC 10500]
MANSNDDRSTDTTTNTQNKTTPPPDNKADSENPFIAFRRYADEQISSMLQAVMGLPSSAVPPFSDKWLYFQNTDNNDRGADRESDYRSDDHRPCRRWGFHRDDNFFDRWHSHHRFSDRGFNSFFDGFPMNLGSFLFPESMLEGDSQTPYSPLYLERSQGHDSRYGRTSSSLFSSRKPADLDPNEPRWRDAFEDLLRVTNGQEMLDRDTEPERSKQSAEKWIKGLIQRGSLGNNWRLLGSQDSQSGLTLERFQQHDRDRRGQEPPRQQEDFLEDKIETKDIETELDLYDRFLDDILNAHERYSRAFADSPLMRLLDEERRRHTQRDNYSQSSEDTNISSKDWLEYTFDGNKNLLASQMTTDNNTSEESRVISTMTRSVRRTLPDGSILTKTIKTKRFADGREESDESTEVIPPPTSEKNSEAVRDVDNDKDSQGGWFWTR